ncbi:hypothetical protein GCM10012276_13980 [Nocardioides deserti]|nr:hypothetical protein GCM10012276_13980 [Nocardioides deserti]
MPAERVLVVRVVMGTTLPPEQVPGPSRSGGDFRARVPGGLDHPQMWDVVGPSRRAHSQAWPEV